MVLSERSIGFSHRSCKYNKYITTIVEEGKIKPLSLGKSFDNIDSAVVISSVSKAVQN